MLYGYPLDLGSPEDYLTALQRVKDVRRAFTIGQQEAPNEIYRQTGYAVSEFLAGILPALLQICMVQAASTALGAAVGGIIGSAFAGVGAIPGAIEGAATGFSVSATVLAWLGLGFLFVAVGRSLSSMAALLQHAVVRAWRAADHPPDQRSFEVQQAGRDIARAMGLLMLLILQAIVAWLLKRGIDKLPDLVAELRKSKLGQGFAEWVEKNAAKLYEDPKLRPKQVEGSTTKAGAQTEAQSPSQLAGRRAAEEEAPAAPHPKSASDIKAIPKGSRPDPSEYLSKEYIDDHLRHFKDGASRFTLQSNLDKYGVAQRDGTTFVMPKAEADKLLASTEGNPRALEQALGLPANTLENSQLMRVDIPSPEKFNLRIPSGNEAGANDLWIPGGKLPGGNLEAVLDAGNMPPGSYTATPIKF